MRRIGTIARFIFILLSCGLLLEALDSGKNSRNRNKERKEKGNETEKLSVNPNTPYLAFAVDLSESMNVEHKDINQKAGFLENERTLFPALLEEGTWFGEYGFSTGNPKNGEFETSYIGMDGKYHTGLFNETSVLFPMRRINNGSDRESAMNSVNGEETYHCSPLGQGLLRAAENLRDSPSDASKAIVLFSDGIQNISPFIGSSPPFQCERLFSYSGIDVTNTIGGNNIKLFSVFFGEKLGWSFDLMAQLRDSTRGDHIFGNVSWFDLASTFYGIRGALSDIVYFERNKTGYLVPEKRFEVDFDSGVEVATVAVAWSAEKKHTELRVECRKKGETEWNQPEELDAPCFKIIRFRPGKNTSWEFRLKQIGEFSATSDYSLAVFSDVEYAHLDAFLDCQGFETGNDIKILAKLDSIRQNSQNISVFALVEIPERSFSNLLEKYSHRLNPSFDRDTNQISSLLNQLKTILKRKNPHKFDLYPHKYVWIKLNDDGTELDEVAHDGLFTGSLSGDFTQIAGLYEFTIYASGPLYYGRNFRRFAFLSTICSPGPADPKKSRVKMSLCSRDANDHRKVDVVIAPKDKYGNSVFPGTGRNITVRSIGEECRLEGEVVDNLDSTFSQEMVVEPDGKATVEVEVGEISLGAYSLFALSRHEAGFHFGVATPEGSFDEDVTSGNSLALSYAYRLNGNLSVKSDICCNRLDNRKGWVRLFYHLTSYLQYRYRIKQIEPYFMAGMGYYSLEDSHAALGYSVGAGLYYVVSRNVNIDFSMRVHRVRRELDVSFMQFYIATMLKF